MKAIRLPVSIAVDVCIHHDAIIVVRHSGSDVVVEGFDFNLDERGEVLTIRGIAGNAAPRIHSWAGVLWLAYRDSFDRGYLIRMDSGEAVQLSPMFNAMSPFGFGRDCVAWMGDPRIAFVIGLGEPPHHNNAHTFSDSMATGLSHVQDGRPVTWDEMRTLRPYAVGFHQSGEFLMGEDFANRGLRGEVIGRPGRFVLWTDTNMQGPRLAAFNGKAALVSWASGGQHARLAIISPEDLTTEPEPVPPEPEPIPEPEPEPEPMPEIPDQTHVVKAVREKYPTPLGDRHAECLLEIARTIGFNAGLLRKDSGTNIQLPDGTRVAQDIICFPDGNIYDCLGDGEGAATPSWSHAGVVELSRYYRVSGTPEPPPDDDDDEPQPPPPNADSLALILHELRRLNAHLGVR